MNENKELALEKLYERFSKYNTEVLELMGKTIKKFEGLTPSQAHKLAQQLKYGNDIDEIIVKLSKISDLSKNDVVEILEKTAKDNVEFAEPYYNFKNINTSYLENENFKKIVDSVSKVTNDTFENMSKTTAFKLLKLNENKTKYVPMLLNIKETYYEIIDRCVIAISTGQTDYKQAMRSTVNQLADSGVKKVYYDNVGKVVNRLNKKTGKVEKTQVKETYARRLDSTVRQNILTGVRQVNIEMQNIIGDEIGADGIEISAHGMCAEDHQDIQGKQYSKKEFEKLNGSLVRPIGELNCRHMAFNIILGVQLPSYTQKQLNSYKQNSNSKFEFEGKTYTKYEGTQLQRKIETEVRKQKDRQIIAKAEGDLESVNTSQAKISQLTKKYNELSKISGLPTKMDRMTVSNYKRTATSGYINSSITPEIKKTLLEDKKIVHSTNNLKEILNDGKLLAKNTDIGLYEKDGKISNYGKYNIHLKPESLNGKIKIYQADGGTRREGIVKEKTNIYYDLETVLYSSKKNAMPYDQINVKKDINISNIDFIEIPSDTNKKIIDLLEKHKIKYRIYQSKSDGNSDMSGLLNMLKRQKKS